MTTNGCCAARSHLRTLSDRFERPTPLARLVLPLCGEKPTVSALPACSPLRTHLPRKKRLALFTPKLYAAPPLFVNKLAQTNSTQFYNMITEPILRARSSPRGRSSALFILPALVQARRGVGMFARWSTQGVRPRSALAKTPCADGAARSFFLCLRSCKHGAGLGCLPGGARGACAPVRHSQKQPCCALSLFCPRLSALYAPRYGARISPVEHAGRAPPFGTRKSSRAAHCLFFI